MYTQTQDVNTCVTELGLGDNVGKEARILSGEKLEIKFM